MKNYQQSIKINFSKNPNHNTGAEIDFNSAISGFASVVQDALIHTITIQGSNKVIPTLGTQFIADAWAGKIYGVDGIIHACNFAAMDTMDTLNKEIRESIPYDASKIFTTLTANEELASFNQSLIKEYKLTPKKLSEQGAVLNAYFISTKGEIIGEEIEPLLLQ